MLGTINPNPASDIVSISYLAEDATSAYIMITEQTTNNSYNHILDINLLQTSIDVTSYPTGIYLVSLICDGNLITTKQLLKI